MSGGTWDYADRRLSFLADELRGGHVRGGDPDSDMEFPAARAAMAALLETTAELLQELDYHYAGDSYIDDETIWLTQAQQHLRTVVATFVQTPP